MNALSSSMGTKSPMNIDREGLYFSFAVLVMLFVGGFLWREMGRATDDFSQQAAASTYVVWSSDTRDAAKLDREMTTVGDEMEQQLNDIQKELELTE